MLHLYYEYHVEDFLTKDELLGLAVGLNTPTQKTHIQPGKESFLRSQLNCYCMCIARAELRSLA